MLISAATAAALPGWRPIVDVNRRADRHNHGCGEHRRERDTVSFYDDEQPTQAHSTGSRAPKRGSSSGGGRDGGDQTVATRRLMAAGAAVVVLLVLVIGVKSCVDSRTTSQLKEFNRKSSQLVTQSDTQVGRQFFKQIQGASGKAPTELQNSVNQLVLLAQDQVKQAKSLDAPDSLASAKQALVMSMQLRHDGLQAISRDLQTAVSRNANDSKNAVAAIAGSMRAFDAADVVYELKVSPVISKAFDDDGIAVGTGGEQIAKSNFLPDWKWLDPSFVSSMLSGTGGSQDPATPGRHGHGLDSVSAGGTDLSADADNSVPGSPPPAFAVTFTNGGDVDEANVTVTVKVEGGPTPIVATKVVASTKAGQQQTVQVPLASAPPIGQKVNVTVTISPVAGEADASNNTATYPVTFS